MRMARMSTGCSIIANRFLSTDLTESWEILKWFTRFILFFFKLHKNVILEGNKHLTRYDVLNCQMWNKLELGVVPGKGWI